MAMGVIMSPDVITAPKPQMLVRCHYCSIHKPESGVMTIGDSVKMCLYCREKHVEEIIKFHPVRECAHCHKSFDELASLGFDLFTVHWMDRSYQILCVTCDVEYVKKRADLYGPTEFGYQRKLR